MPVEHKEAALALGATRWEMIRMAVLPVLARRASPARAMLGLGRAIGETIAVTLVIGNAPQIGKHLFAQGYTLAAVIANEFGEAASDPLHRAALIAAGLVLFVLTLLVNAIARYFVVRAERSQRHRVAEGRWPDERASRRIAAVSARRRRTDQIARGSSCWRHAASRSCRSCSSSTTCSRRGSAPGAGTSSPPTRRGRFLGDPGGIKSGDPRHDRDRRARHG